MRLALLSTARINELLVAGARRVPGIEVVAIGSRDRSRAQEQAAKLDVARVHGSYQAVLDDPDVDAVYVALPNSLHVEWSIRALEAGKHVLCEKPLSRHPTEVERAFDTAAHSDRVLVEAFMWRHHPQAQALVSLLPEIGRLRLIRSAFSFVLDRPADVRFSAELEGGALMDVGCYCVSATRLLAGEPEVVAAHAVLHAGVDVRLTATLQLARDVLAHFDCGLDIVHRDELEVVGDQGALFLDDPWHSRVPGIEVRRADGTVRLVDVERADPYGCELEDFAAAVAGDRPPPFGRDDALGQARTLAALFESAATGHAASP